MFPKNSQDSQNNQLTLKMWGQFSKVNSNFGALYFFCYDLGSHRCLTVTNLSKTIIWIQNIHQVSLTKSNLLKWTTLILKSVCIFQRSRRGKRGFVIHLVGFTFFYLSNMYWLYSLQPCGFCGICLLHAEYHEIFVMSEVSK